jgi:hypothetical protein
VLCLIWPVNGLLLIVSAVDLLDGLRRGAGTRVWTALQNGGALAVGVGLGFLPQLAGWYGATGTWLGSTYGKVGDFFHWTQPATLPLLFSWSQHGLLSWHPVFVPAFLGLFLLGDRRLALGLALCVVAELYVLSCWSVWWTGIGFGNRFFLNLFPVAALGMALVLARLWQPARVLDTPRRAAVVGLAVLLVFLNLSLLNAYRSDAVAMGIKGPNYVQDPPPAPAALARTLMFELPLTLAALTRDFWVNQAFFASRLRTALSGDPGALGSVAVAASVVLACCWLALVVALGGVRSTARRAAFRRAGRRMPVLLTVTLLLICAWLALAVRRSPQRDVFLRFDAGESILRPGQKATFVPQGYLEPTREVDLISFLTYAVYAPQGHTVALLRVFAERADPLQFPIVVGVHTAETSGLRSEVRRQMAHSEAQTTPVHEWVTRAYSSALYPAHAFLARFALPEPLRIERIEVETLQGGGDLVLRDVFLRG